MKAAGVYFPPTDLPGNGVQDSYIQANNAAWEEITNQALPGSTAIAADAAAPEIAVGADAIVKLPEVSPQAPRFLIVHGDEEPLISTGKSSRYFTAMRNAGVATDMIVRRSGGDSGPTIQAELKTLANWFDKQLTSD